MTDPHSNAAAPPEQSPVESPDPKPDEIHGTAIPSEPWDPDLGERLSRHTNMFYPIRRWLQWVLAIPFLVAALVMLEATVTSGRPSPVLIIPAILTAFAVTLFGFVQIFKQVLKQFLWMRRLYRNGMAETLQMVPASHVLLQQAAYAQWRRILRQTAYPIFASFIVFVLVFSSYEAMWNSGSGLVNWDILGGGVLSLLGVLIYARVLMLLPYMATWTWIFVVSRGAVLLLASIVLMELMDEFFKSPPTHREIVHLIIIPLVAAVIWWIWVLKPSAQSTGKGMMLRWQCASNGSVLWSLITPPQPPVGEPCLDWISPKQGKPLFMQRWSTHYWLLGGLAAWAMSISITAGALATWPYRIVGAVSLVGSTLLLVLCFGSCYRRRRALERYAASPEFHSACRSVHISPGYMLGWWRADLWLKWLLITLTMGLPATFLATMAAQLILEPSQEMWRINLGRVVQIPPTSWDFGDNFNQPYFAVGALTAAWIALRPGRWIWGYLGAASLLAMAAMLAWSIRLDGTVDIVEWLPSLLSRQAALITGLLLLITLRAGMMLSPAKNIALILIAMLPWAAYSQGGPTMVLILQSGIAPLLAMISLHCLVNEGPKLRVIGVEDKAMKAN